MYVKVKVTPNAKREIVSKISDNEFEISVREPAEHNLANKKICTLLASHFSNPLGGVKIINGHHARTKLLKIGND
ncbi:MAG TPA: DUF167 domain-containing protein [Candidatus Paceibacterota bacterium]|nr:DUF167 domain-containing protein [Candidatus Paceibacterota bacterium]HRZ34472.1 DUF167 domain-containing protein [Candidatus Paceibacterota bacterium]